MKLEKVTIISRRTYDDACGTAHGLELIGERWALLVVRELMLGPKRFGDIRRDLPGLSANVLTQRLEALEAHGVLRRRRLAPPASVQVYELTDWGYEAEPIIQTLGRWAARSPGHDPTLPLSAVSILLSFHTMFDPAKTQGFSTTVGFQFGDENFRVDVTPEAIKARRAEADDAADAIFIGSPPAVAEAAYGPAGAAAPEARGDLVIEGSRRVADRFLALFELPPKAAVA
jgi:DNA-binding HxlR family transcriptional regulator